MPAPQVRHFEPDGCPVRVCAAWPSPRDAGAQMITPCFGAGATRREAESRAMAELRERRAALWRGDEAVVQARWPEVAHRAVPPNAVMLYSARQAGTRGPEPLLGLDERRRLPWVEAEPLAGGHSPLVPAQLVYFRAPGRPGRADSNGVAAGRTVTSATVRALLELVERDAVALWWYHRVRRPAVPVARTGDPLVARLLAWLDARGRETWGLDLTTDLGLPVVAMVSVQRAPARPRPLLGFAARLDQPSAIRRALVELVQEEAIVRATDAGDWGQLRADRSWLRHATLEGHPHLSPRPLSGEGGRARGPRTPRVRSDAAALSVVVRRLVSAGLAPMRIDLSREGDALRVVRALVPGLRPWWPRFAAGRLFDAPVRAGWFARVGDESSLNPFGIWF